MPHDHANISHKFTLVINAGGESLRMGRTKALLPVPLADGSTRPLIAHIAARLRPLSPERIVVVTSNEEVVTRSGIAPPVEFVADAYPGMGALGGIATGLEVVDEWAIMVACDMPLVDAAVFEYLCEIAASSDELVTATEFSGRTSTQLSGQGGEREREGDRKAKVLRKADRMDVVVPIVGGYEQTLYALYHRRCLPAIGKRLAAEEKKITRFFPDVAVREVTEDELRPLDPDFRSFINANTPADWEKAVAMLCS